MRKRSTIIMLVAAAVCFLIVLGLVFFGPKGLFYSKAAEDTQQKQPDTTTEDRYIFLTYAEGKNGEYNFFRDCYVKAQQAVANGRADSIQEYILDKDFDKDALKKAHKAVEAGEAASELEYMANHPDSGKMSFLLYFDPFFASAWGCYIDQMDASEDKILKAEQDLPVNEQPNAALQRFVDNQDDWDEAIAKIQEVIYADNNKFDLKELGNYTSSMYAQKDGIAEGIPAVVVKTTGNQSGHFIMIELENGIVLKFRLECGYQPVDVPNFPPDLPPVTPPEEPPLTPKDPKDGIEPNPDATTEEWYQPDPQNPDDQDTTETPDPEPDLPDIYVPPAPPTTTEATTEVTTESTTVTTTESYDDVVDDDPADVEDPFEDIITDGDPDPKNVE